MAKSFQSLLSLRMWRKHLALYVRFLEALIRSTHERRFWSFFQFMKFAAVSELFLLVHDRVLCRILSNYLCLKSMPFLWRCQSASEPSLYSIIASEGRAEMLLTIEAEAMILLVTQTILYENCEFNVLPNQERIRLVHKFVAMFLKQLF